MFSYFSSITISDQPVTIENNTYQNNLRNDLNTNRADIGGNALLGSAGQYQFSSESIISHYSYLLNCTHKCM